MYIIHHFTIELAIYILDKLSKLVCVRAVCVCVCSSCVVHVGDVVLGLFETHIQKKMCFNIRDVRLLLIIHFPSRHLYYPTENYR